MPHLDASLFIEELWGDPNQVATGERHPTKDGWPVYRTQYHIADFRQDVRVHSFLCEATQQRAHEACRDVEVGESDLLKLAKLLKKLATDPKAMADYEDFDDTMFGYKTGTERHALDLKYRMERAPALAKRIRKAAKYIKKRKKEKGTSLEHAWVYAVYRCIW